MRRRCGVGGVVGEAKLVLALYMVCVEAAETNRRVTPYGLCWDVCAGDLLSAVEQFRGHDDVCGHVDVCWEECQ